MDDLYVWHSIQLKALHAELLDRRLQLNAKRMQSRDTYTCMHPGRYVVRALRPLCIPLLGIKDYSTLNLYGITLITDQKLVCQAWRYERGGFKTALLDAVRTNKLHNKLHKAPSRLTIAQLAEVLLTASV